MNSIYDGIQRPLEVSPDVKVCCYTFYILSEQYIQYILDFLSSAMNLQAL